MPPVLASPALWTITQAKVMVWLLIVTRVTGLLATMPSLGSERLPAMTRAALALLLATIIAPVVPWPKATPTGIWDMAGFMVVEFAAGLFMGLMVAWLLEAVAFAGQLMDFQMGFSFMQIVDPATSHQVSISGTILLQLTLLFVFVSGLHQPMIQALVESYRVLPMGSGLPMRPLELVYMVGLLLSKGFQLAFPVMLTLFLVDALEGISAKFMPQLQLIQISFPLKIAVGLAVLGILLREFTGWVQPLLEMAPREALRLLA